MPLSFELYINFLNEMFQSVEMGWFLNAINKFNFYEMDANDLEMIESTFNLVKDYYFSSTENKKHEFSEYSDINEEHEQINDLLLDIDGHIQNMIFQLEKYGILEEYLVNNIVNCLDILEDKIDDIRDLKFNIDICFKVVKHWDEDTYLEFINFFINKSDYKYFISSMDEIVQSLRINKFDQSEINSLAIIKELVNELIIFYEQFHINSAYDLGNKWFDIDYDIRMSLIFINEKIRLIEYTFIEKGYCVELLELLEKLFNYFSIFIKAIILVIPKNE